MDVVVYSDDTQISKHFNSREFKCSVCNEVKISNELIRKLEELFSYVNASKCIISSGYRSVSYDIKENGFAGRHSEGIACDCAFYDKNNKIIPSSIIICAAWELGFTGIAYINNNYTHLDIRKNSTYYGDERRGNSSYWSNPYVYFNVSKSDFLKYVNSNKISYQVYSGKWYPSVLAGTDEYAGVFGKGITRILIDKLKYRVRSNGKWLPEVIGRSDFAGYSDGREITDVSIEGVSYRVHVKGGNWLGWVNGYNINDYENGYAGNGKVIDAIQLR